MNVMQGFLLFAGRGVAGATFAIGPELTVEADEATIVCDALDSEDVIVEHAVVDVVVAPDEIDVVLTADDRELTVD